MTIMARTDTSIMGRWWWTVDRWMLASLAAIAAIGALLVMAASPPVAERIGHDPFYFVYRQFIFLAVALAVVLGVSLLSARNVRRLGIACYAAGIVLMAAALFIGEAANGAARWIRLGGFSLQPSEFAKPGLIVAAAWMFSERRLDERFPGYAAATALYALLACLLLLQPDVGMAIVVSAVWGIQFFLAGLPLSLVLLISAVFLSGGIGAYFAYDHVRGRIDRFLNNSASGGDDYQVSRALEAFHSGGLFGRGPGEGRVKMVLPDAHSDFILAVAGEEFGLFACLIIVGLFAFVMLRGFARVIRNDDLFVLLAASGLLAQFGLQAIINMASSLHLTPPKGMTLPFVSYGGSSALAMAISMGMALALTRVRSGHGESR